MRWCSKWECETQVLELFGDQIFCVCSAGLVPKTCGKILQHLPSKSDELTIQVVTQLLYWILESHLSQPHARSSALNVMIPCRIHAAIQVCHLISTAAMYMYFKRIASTTKSEEYCMPYAKTCIQLNL